MKSFLRAAMARAESEHEQRLIYARGSELPGGRGSDWMGATPGCGGGGDQRSRAPARDAAIVAATKAHPSHSPTQIAALVKTTHTTVIRVQRREGVYREPVCRDGRWGMP